MSLNLAAPLRKPASWPRSLIALDLESELYIFRDEEGRYINLLESPRRKIEINEINIHESGLISYFDDGNHRHSYKINLPAEVIFVIKELIESSVEIV